MNGALSLCVINFRYNNSTLSRNSRNLFTCVLVCVSSSFEINFLHQLHVPNFDRGNSAVK